MVGIIVYNVFFCFRVSHGGLAQYNAQVYTGPGHRSSSLLTSHTHPFLLKCRLTIAIPGIRCALDSDLVDPVVSQMLGLTPSSSAQALQLQRAQNHIADVNIYYTGQPHVKIESFTEAVLTAFCGQFAAELTEQLPRFQYVQTLNEEAPRHTEFLALFSAFSDTLDRMELPSGLKYPAANAAPSPNSIDPADTEEKEKQTRTASV